jgi:hypothetical protein
MTTTAAERAVLVRRWERASEWPLMVAAMAFLVAYAVPILDRLSCDTFYCVVVDHCDATGGCFC